MSCFRERLTEIHDEHEEREQRWNRIATLLNRDDLNSPGLTSSIPHRVKESPRIRT